jgi:hypothetical protein
MAQRRGSRSRPNPSRAGVLVVLLIAFMLTLRIRWRTETEVESDVGLVTEVESDVGVVTELPAGGGEGGGGVTELPAGGDEEGGEGDAAELRRCGAGDATQGEAKEEIRNDVADGKHCNVEAHAEYAGAVLKWGANNVQTTQEGCCNSCQAVHGCNTWVWCGAAKGCRGTEGVFGECWLKHQPNAAEKQAFNRGVDIPWWGCERFRQ